MPKIRYKNYKFRKESYALIGMANQIISEYQAQGHELTLRQLYYQFVARDIIPNSDASYGKLGTVINKGRVAGLIDWSSIVDRTRTSRSNTHWNDPEEIIQAAADSFRLDTRATQEVYIEVWVEKDALVDIVGRVCRELDVPYFSCRGYVSQTAMWEAAQRITKEVCISEKHYIKHGLKEAVLLHLGDHDPSGINMTNDIQKRLHLFEAPIEIERIALTMEQIEKHKPPPNPAKITDSRYWSYANIYGNESWELDALNPEVITQVIASSIAGYTNEDVREDMIIEQELRREELQYAAENWKKLLKEKE